MRIAVETRDGMDAYDEAVTLARRHADEAEAVTAPVREGMTLTETARAQAQMHALLSIAWSLIASNGELPGGRARQARRPT